MNAALLAKLRAEAMQVQLRVRASERSYSTALSRIMRGLNTAMMDVILSHWQLKSGRLDAADRTSGLDMDAVEVHFLRQVPEKVGAAFDAMAPKLARDTKTSLAGIAPSDMGIDLDIARARDSNIQLVENAGRVYAADVREVFENPDNFNLGVNDLRDLLVERGNVSVSHAELIATDQVLKLSGAIAKTRQQNAGVNEYVWSGVLDVRERETHRDMEGRRCSWAAPPQPVGYHPGQDYRCRCVPIPYVPELEGL